ncbi:hypothetical protein Tco_0787496, partial [Tanacetum coccineum]
SGYGDIATLHFSWEGADTFYVTRYDEHGSEIGGYNDLMTQQRRSRLLVTLGNDPGESLDFIQQIHAQRFHIEFRHRKHRVLKRLRLFPGTKTDYGHVLYGLGWEKLKHFFDFTNGKRVVLTNMLGNDLRVLFLEMMVMKLIMKTCHIQRLLGLKRLYGFLEVTAAQVHNGNYAKWFGINKWYQSFALRNFVLEDMELESTNNGPTAKLPILKLGEYEMWAIRIKQYFQI